jgi:transcriptional regulator with XRE-family HTH domain
MAALPEMLEHDRTRAGCSVEQAARRLGVSGAVYREIEDGTRTPTSAPSWRRSARLDATRATAVSPWPWS